MELTAEQWELFPTIAERVKPKGFVRQYIEATAEHGALVTQAQIAATLGVSRQRVSALVSQGRLATVRVGDWIYVPAVALEAYLNDQRKAGRPEHRPRLSEFLKASLQSAK